MRRSAHRPLVAAAGCVVAAAALTGCQLGSSTTHANVVNGKTLFAEKCGACHTLSRAGTTGVTGPNLDQAFAQSRADGLGQSTFAGVVEHQILHPNTRAEIDPETGKDLPIMPAKLVQGEDARDVAAYVAQAVAVPGKDEGQLASVGVKKAQGTAKEHNGLVDIPTAPAGLAYQYKDAEAKAGKLTLESKNPQPIGHNIAIEGSGVNQKGPVVQGGAVSKISLDLKPGTYTFFCSVPGHREGGMVGKLVVK